VRERDLNEMSHDESAEVAIGMDIKGIHPLDLLLNAVGMILPKIFVGKITTRRCDEDTHQEPIHDKGIQKCPQVPPDTGILKCYRIS
jgi:hypothetical protein